ncbi:hypothetical protein [Actinomycetospora sp.]|jgi:hypothetical protein|uniref:hypothetical protein n=1 Tax=Actinomycetospora sp. TaxID=1872135 RepID=UPI002F3F3C76
MAFFGWLLLIYVLVAFGCWMVFGRRFLLKEDIRRPRNSDAFDLFGPMIGIVLISWTLIAMNPARFVRVAGKCVLWPVTLWRWFERQNGSPSASTSTSTVVPERTAPRLSPTYFVDVLARAGRPPTPHNLFALQERIGIAFTIKARQFVDSTGAPGDWSRFVERAGYPRAAADMPEWPQQVLDGLVVWDGDIAPHLTDFPEKYAAMLLEGVGRSDGGFFGGPTSAPLPTATEWNMNSLTQPGAVAVPPPSDSAVPGAASVLAPGAAPAPASQWASKPMGRAISAPVMPPMSAGAPSTGRSLAWRAPAGPMPSRHVQSSPPLTLAPPARPSSGPRHARPDL